MRKRGLIATALLSGLSAFAAVFVIERMQIARTEPAAVAEPERADRILVEKAARRLTLLRGDTVLATYPISLGFAPQGHKQREGDGRTPEGLYRIEWKNPESVAHLSMKVSYPEAADIASAEARGQAPGGNIMIHGILNGFGWVSRLHRMMDWTQGCIAVTNTEMREIYARVEPSTPIEIRP